MRVSFIFGISLLPSIFVDGFYQGDGRKKRSTVRHLACGFVFGVGLSDRDGKGWLFFGFLSRPVPN